MGFLIVRKHRNRTPDEIQELVDAVKGLTAAVNEGNKRLDAAVKTAVTSMNKATLEMKKDRESRRKHG